MDKKRTEDLTELKSYGQDIDKDMTMILQSLQWDRKHILQHPTMVTCKIDANHKVLPEKAEEHERECLLRQNGYSKEDQLLPDPVDADASTLIKLKKEDITQIIDNAATSDPTFQRVRIVVFPGCVRCSLIIAQVSLTQGVGSGELEPQSLDRLQTTYTTDERRAIHDAVVSAAPSCHDLTDLALTGVGEVAKAPVPKSRTEILAELRDMRRRRTKYRVAAKTNNYSDTLRDVIKTQMELYNEALGDTQAEVIEVDTDSNKTEDQNDNKKSKDDDKDKSERRKESSKRESSRDRSRRQKDRRESKYEELYKDRRIRDSPRKDRRSSDRKRRDKSRSRDRRRDTSREGSRSKERRRDTSRDRSRSRDRRRDTSRDRSRSKERRRDTSRDRSRSRDRRRDTSRDRSRSRNRRRDNSRDRSRSRDKRRDTSRDRSRSKDRRRNNSRDRSLSRDRRRDNSRDRSRSRDRRRDTSRDRSRSKNRRRDTSRDRSRSRDRRRDNSRDRKRKDDSKTRYGDRYERESDRRDRDRLRMDRLADAHERYLLPSGSLGEERYREERRDRKEKQKKPKRLIKIDDRDTLISDEERARNLIIEIKREIKPNREGHRYSDCTFTGTIEINQEKRYRDYISRSGAYQKLPSRAKDDKSKVKYDKVKKEREEVKLKTLKYYRPRDRERSPEKVVKRSRTEHKHKIYSAIYSELEKLRSHTSDYD